MFQNLMLLEYVKSIASYPATKMSTSKCEEVTSTKGAWSTAVKRKLYQTAPWIYYYLIEK